ncbi:MAG: FAD-dependent oxidoreductase [Oscillospiraceae bacterium]|nr:FAD-dependent oxidoreductase [Clostridiaceae bacterium]MDY5949128.1 FAD-dependent oxidoreductase [Oscillospiraceae bacterium]
MYDIIIIGAGPAGLTAAVYARRAEKSVLVLEKGVFGGQVTYSPLIENYPGFAAMSGNEFAEKLIDQALSQGADIEMETVTEIRDNGSSKTVVTEEGEHEAKAVIIATGVKHRQIGLPNENELVGEGVSYCAVCDGAFFRGQTVAVLGGGNSALQEAALLSETCKKVYVIQNLDYLTGEAKLAEKLKARDNVEFIMGTVISALNGEKSLESLTLRREADGAESKLEVSGLFVAIGLIPGNAAFADIAGLDEWGYIDSDESCLTKTPGVFTAGDCRKKQIRQITTAAADGSVAALAACRYIDSM